jgi:hypothetical protein
LESSTTEPPSHHFDVALVESKQVEPLMRLATADAGAGDAASPPRPSGASAAAGSRASSANALLASRFTKMAKSCAIVLMHEEEVRSPHTGSRTTPLAW